jgi:quercetin dioxygenase-like cupin family protein
MTDYSIVCADDVEDAYAGTDVPGEFHPLTRPLDTEQLAVTMVRIPPHSDFEQGTGHYHEGIEELYIVARGTLTFRCGDDITTLGPRTVVRVAPHTPRSHRNESDEVVELWIFSPKTDTNDATKLDDFWEASPLARQHAET